VKRTTLLLTVFTAAMVMALVMVAMAVPVFAGGADDDEDNDNESANGSATRNGQIVFRRYFDPDQTKGTIFTMNPDGSHIRQITHPQRAGWTTFRRGLLMERGSPSSASRLTLARSGSWS
jgi:hypothetical protein